MEELIKLVKEEAQKLREHTTQEEKAHLEADMFEGNNGQRCIYGLLTGNCYNSRATELIGLCCERVYNTRNGWLPDIDYAILNGKPNGTRNRDSVEYFSPIEVLVGDDASYTTMKNAGPIIAYIKGETDELILNQ